VKPGRQKALPALGDLGLDLIHHSRLGEGAQIAELIALTRDDLAHNAAHDLARARLGQVIDDIYLLGRREGADDLANLECKLLGQALLVIRVIFEFPNCVRGKWPKKKVVSPSDGLSHK